MIFTEYPYLALEEDDLATLVSDPTQYFAPETQIIAIEPGEGNEERLHKEDESGKEGKNNKVKKIAVEIFYLFLQKNLIGFLFLIIMSIKSVVRRLLRKYKTQ